MLNKSLVPTPGGRTTFPDAIVAGAPGWQAVRRIFEHVGHVLLGGIAPLGHDEAEFGDQAAQLVRLGGALGNDGAADPMQAEDGLLFDGLDGGKAHGGAMMRASWPRLRWVRAQRWAPLHASISRIAAGRLAKLSSSLLRDTVFTTTTLPWASTPCTLNAFLARSIPAVVTFMTDSPPLSIDRYLTPQSGIPDAVGGGEADFIR
jgi:hypothetical protein